MSVTETEESSAEVERCLESVDESVEAHPPCDSWPGAVMGWHSVLLDDLLGLERRWSSR